jgi:vitamin B12 transporter
MTYPKAFPGLLLTVVSVSALNLPSAFAEEANPGNELDPIVVTATLGPRTVGESLSSVTTFDEEEIRQQNPSSVSDLLRGQPGIDVVTNGTFGKNTSVFTRGTNNESTIFLMDGIRLRSATTGGAPWQFFPVELIERMEVVRGPRSALYGADAVGGVVQAFTLDPEVGRQGWVEAGAGNFDTQKVSGGASASSGSTRFSLSGLHKETDGTEIREGGEDKGFRQTAGVGRIAHDLTNGGEASLVVMQSEGNTAFDSGNTDYLVRALGARLETPVSDYWRSAIQISESRDEGETFSENSSVFDTRIRTARWENTLTFAVHELAVGAELQSDEVRSTTDFAENSRTNEALFSQLRLNFGATDVQLALRGDDNEAYGQETTGGFSIGHAFDPSHRIRASYGTAFRAPTFNELYGFQDFGSFTFEGNPDIQPEESQSVELGVSGRYPNWYWDTAIFQLDVENLIENPFVGGAIRPTNVSEARIRGIELGSGVRMAGWDLGLKLTLLDPRNRDTDNRLARRSAKSLRFDLDKTLGNWSLGGTVIAKGFRYDDADNEERLPGFATLNLRAGWEFAQDWKLALKIDNVTDKIYATAQRFGGDDYLSAGTTGFLSVRHDFR